MKYVWNEIRFSQRKCFGLNRAQQEGQISKDDLAAEFISFLLREAGEEEFSAREWKMGDRSHWDRWHPEFKNCQL